MATYSDSTKADRNAISFLAACQEYQGTSKFEMLQYPNGFAIAQRGLSRSGPRNSITANVTAGGRVRLSLIGKEYYNKDGMLVRKPGSFRDRLLDYDVAVIKVVEWLIN